MSAILKPVFRHEIRRQMSVYFETVIQSTPMGNFSFGFTEGSFLLLNGQKHLRSVAEDLISKEQKRTKRYYQKRRRHGYYRNSQAIIFQQVITLSDFYSACENKCHAMKTSSVQLLLRNRRLLMDNSGFFLGCVQRICGNL